MAEASGVEVRDEARAGGLGSTGLGRVEADRKGPAVFWDSEVAEERAVTTELMSVLEIPRSLARSLLQLSNFDPSGAATLYYEQRWSALSAREAVAQREEVRRAPRRRRRMSTQGDGQEAKRLRADDEASTAAAARSAACDQAREYVRLAGRDDSLDLALVDAERCEALCRANGLRQDDGPHVRFGLVAEARLLGFASYHVVHTPRVLCFELVGLAVDEPHRGKGWGRALLEATFLALSITHGALLVLCYPRRVPLDTRPFYLKMMLDPDQAPGDDHRALWADLLHNSRLFKCPHRPQDTLFWSPAADTNLSKTPNGEPHPRSPYFAAVVQPRLLSPPP